MYDSIIVGGGPAGLSTALLLARSRRTVLVCDEGRPRNRASHAIHGYLTRDGTHPKEFAESARKELQRYETVTLREGVVASVARSADGFQVQLSGGDTATGRVVVLATGMQDTLPQLEGLEALYGTSVHHCPYCDGWEHRDETIAVHGQGEAAALFAQRMLRWSRRVVLCTDGDGTLAAADRAALEHHGIKLHEGRIRRLVGAGGALQRIEFEGDQGLEAEALFFCSGHAQRSGLAETLGVSFLDNGAVDSARDGATNVPGVYVVGDASRDAQLVVIAAAEGAAAGVAINEALTRAELARGLDPV